MAASLFAWLFNFVELTCLPAALKALILHSFFLFSYVNALKGVLFFMRFYAAPSVSVSSTTGAVCAAVRVTLSAVRMVPSPSAKRMVTRSPVL